MNFPSHLSYGHSLVALPFWNHNYYGEDAVKDLCATGLDVPSHQFMFKQYK